MSRYDVPCAVCGATPTRLYPGGRRCREHTPAAIAGHPEPPAVPGPPWWVRGGRVVAAPPLAASRLADDRAIASGKRRATPARYREARAAVDAAKTRPARLRLVEPIQEARD